MRDAPLSATVFGVLGLVGVVSGVVLAVLGSFAYVAAFAIGLFFVAAALVARSARSASGRVAGVLAIASAALLMFGQVATPLFYAGWGLLAGSAALALLGSRRSPPS